MRMRMSADILRRAAYSSSSCKNMFSWHLIELLCPLLRNKVRFRPCSSVTGDILHIVTGFEKISAASLRDWGRREKPWEQGLVPGYNVSP